MSKPARIDLDGKGNTGARSPQGTARVWDPFVRAFHWSLALSFAIAWLTARTSDGIHQWAGYCAGALVLMRLTWGFLGTPYARFSQFVRHPSMVQRYLLDIANGREARYVGHNPAGGAMVLALMAAMIATALSGWMMTTDAYFGIDWVETAHSLSAHGLLLLVLVHLGGVVLASFRHRENLVCAMLTGTKRQAEAGDIE